MTIEHMYFWNNKRHGKPKNWIEAVSLMQSLATQQDLSDEINENYDDSIDTMLSLSSGFDFIWDELYTEGVVEELDRLRDIFQAQGLNALYKLPIEKPNIAANIKILLMGTVEHYTKDIVMFSEHFNLFLMSGGRILTSSDIYDEDGTIITTLKAYMNNRKNPYKLTSAKVLQGFLDNYAEKMAGMGFFHKGIEQYDKNAVISFLKKADFGHIHITIKASKDDNVIQLQGFINAITPYLSTMLDTYRPEIYPLIEIDYIRFEDKVFGYAKNSEQANKLYQMIDHQVSQINYPTNYAELMYCALNTNSI